MELPFKIDRKLLVSRLAEKSANVNCLSCAQNNWAILEDAALIPQWINQLPAPGIPVAVMICNNCGFTRSHALGAIGLLPQDEAE